MLSIYLGKMDKAIYYPPVYFDNTYEDEWITDELSREMIRDVDRSEVIGAHLIESPVLGPISPKELSGGVKTLILMALDDKEQIFNASACGDNCAKWILKISRMKNGEESMEAKILNTGDMVHNMQEFIGIAGKFV